MCLLLFCKQINRETEVKSSTGVRIPPPQGIIDQHDSGLSGSQPAVPPPEEGGMAGEARRLPGGPAAPFRGRVEVQTATISEKHT